MNRRITTLIFSLLPIILLLFVSIVYAETETFRATYKYVMGDNDTKNDAKTLCFMGAKRRLLEQVGTFITSRTEVSDFKLTKDEITSYSAAFLKIEVENEKTESTGETSAIVMTIKTNVDLDEIKKTLNKIINDDSLKHEITEKNKKISLLEERLQNLQKHLTTANYEKSFQLREDRKDAFQDLYTENENIRKIILAVKERDTTRSRTIKSQSAMVTSILENVQLGMTSEEIRQTIKLLSGSDEEFRRDSWNHSKWIWGRLNFNFRGDDILKIICLDNIVYYGTDYETNSTDYYIIKDRRINVLLNGVYVSSTDKARLTQKGDRFIKKDKRLMKKDEIKEKHPGMYKYIWGD